MSANPYLQEVKFFQGRSTPYAAILVGYAQLMRVLDQEFGTLVPAPDQLALISEKHHRHETQQWQVFTKRYQPKDDIVSHLVFALKYEGIQLHILKALFQHKGEALIMDMVQARPTSQYTRRLWFLYEWLMDVRLDIPDLAKKMEYVEIVNPKFQYTGPVRNSTRHRVKNNLPGSREFCPLIRKTEKLEQLISKHLDIQIEAGLSKVDKELVRRSAAFLLLKDSKASFAIEGENPPSMRARNWGKIIGQAGKNDLTIEEIERLQHIVIGSKKLSHMGIRDVEGFIGEHDRDTFAPIPDHISAKADDLPSLMHGLLEANNLLRGSEYDPVLTATTIAFGFVFIHPLLDGNGRLHRYIIHHILAKMGYTKMGIIFPVSAAILDRIGVYQEVLEAWSMPRLDFIDWKSTSDHNAEILNETIDLYRYYDMTSLAEFLFDCIEDTIDRIIPTELDFLRKYDQLAWVINEVVSLPNSRVDLLIKLLNQNGGKLSKTKRQRLFEDLAEIDIQIIEDSYQEIFNRENEFLDFGNTSFDTDDVPPDSDDMMID